MVKAGMEPRNMTFQVLSRHHVTLNAMDSTATTTKKSEASWDSNNDKGKKSWKRKITHKNNTDKKLKRGKQKTCDVCKISKSDSNAYKTHSTPECKSQEY